MKEHIEQAYKETMVLRIGIVLVIVALVVGATINGYHYLTLRYPDACGVCFDNVVDCESQYWSSSDQALCADKRQLQVEQCLKLCPAQETP